MSAGLSGRLRAVSAVSLALVIMLIACFIVSAAVVTAGHITPPGVKNQPPQTASHPAPQVAPKADEKSEPVHTATASGYPAVRISIDGPLVLATSKANGEKAEYKVSITGGPASAANETQRINWSYSAHIEGDYANENNHSSPLSGSPASGNSNMTGNFTFNVTAPTAECTITLVVNGTSGIDGNASESAQRTMTIKVVTPVILTASVHNYGPVNVKNIRVNFYVDSKFIGYKEIAALDTNSSTNVSMNWTVADYSVGYHTAKMEIVGGGPMVMFNNSSNTESYDFYVSSIGPDTLAKVWLALGAILLTVVIFMFVLAYFSTGRSTAPPVKKL